MGVADWDPTAGAGDAGDAVPSGVPAAVEPAPPAGRGSLPARLEETARRARAYFESALAPNTLRAYASDLADFTTWCKVDAGGLSTLPAAPETVGLYVADLAARGKKAATIKRRLAAIAQLHQEAGAEDPTKQKAVKNTYRGVVREIGSLQEGAAPILVSTLRRMMEALEDEERERSAARTAGARDRALLLLGFAGGFRRSELVALAVGDLDFEEGGIRVLVRRSKTDQEGRGRTVFVPYGSDPSTCPVRNTARWLALTGRSEREYLFCGVNKGGNLQPGGLTGRAVSLIVKKRVRAAGLEPDRYSGHSLRAGLITSATAAGVGTNSIMDQTGHKSVQMVLRYAREAQGFKNNAAARVGL